MLLHKPFIGLKLVEQISFSDNGICSIRLKHEENAGVGFDLALLLRDSRGIWNFSEYCEASADAVHCLPSQRNSRSNTFFKVSNAFLAHLRLIVSSPNRHNVTASSTKSGLLMDHIFSYIWPIKFTSQLALYCLLKLLQWGDEVL